MKIQLMVIFGGKSVEHEISVISAIQAINRVDKEKYDVIPVYLTKDNELYTGEDVSKIEKYRDIPALKKSASRVVLAKEGERVYLYSHPETKGFKKIKKQIDIAFPIVHGEGVEDGSIQGYLKTLGLPFIGSDVIASAAGMDKHVMKTVLADAGVPVLDCETFTKFEYEKDPERIMDALEAKFGYPVIVKPATLGSSIGISKAKDRAELSDALELACEFAAKILVERAVTNLREINCSVVGDVGEADASECEEPLNATTILSFEDKYMGGGKGGAKGGSKGSGMASLARKIPADIPPEMREEVRSLAVKTFKALGCNGVSRIDFLLDVDDGNKIYVNEINTIPGSLSFYLWEPLGISYTKLIDRLVELALKRQREEKSLLHSFDSNVLSLCSSGSLSGSKTKLGG